MRSSVLAPLPMKQMKSSHLSSPLIDLDSRHEQPPIEENDRMRELEKMLDEVRDRNEMLEREAYDKAYQAGEQAGLDLGRKRAEQIVESMQTLLRQAESGLSQMQENADQVILEIAEAIIRQFIGSVLRDHPEYLRDMIEKAAACLPRTDTLKLAVPAQDIALFSRIAGDLPAEFTADEGMSPGTCRIIGVAHDVLIDPQAAISECMQHVRDKLLQGENTPPGDGRPTAGTGGIKATPAEE